MSSILLSLPEILDTYKSWVSKNPQLVSDCETTAKWVSYFLAGKINNSHVLSELIYCLSNLLVLFNDRIISKVKRLELPGSGDKLKVWLTVVEYCEVLFELSSQKLWGNVGKWLIIITIQVFKCISRLVLVYKHKECIIQTPPILPLERAKLVNKVPNYVDKTYEINSNVSFTLKSGRVIRKVDGAPSLNFRDWKPLQAEQCDNKQTIEQALVGKQLAAETIYISKPLVHLASVACFGGHSWKPWIVSLALDLASLHLYEFSKNAKVNPLTPKQRLQLSKRKVLLALYLLRTPFYEKHSQKKINDFLNSLSGNVPLARLICGPLSQYLPFWQSKYFYMWSS